MWIIWTFLGVAVAWMLPPPAFVTNFYSRMGDKIRQKLGG